MYIDANIVFFFYNFTSVMKTEQIPSFSSKDLTKIKDLQGTDFQGLKLICRQYFRLG